MAVFIDFIHLILHNSIYKRYRMYVLLIVCLSNYKINKMSFCLYVCPVRSRKIRSQISEKFLIGLGKVFFYKAGKGSL